ncbi:hypothetical protein Tco_0691355 [Tanacetum coccineum]
MTYSNPLFNDNDAFASSDDESLPEELEDIESEDSYVSKLDEPDLLVTPLSKLNEDECFDPGGDFILEGIEACLTNDDPRSLEDEPDKDDLKYIVKVFDPGIWEKFFSPTYVKLPFEDRHYLSLTYVIRIFLPYFNYPVDSSLHLSFGSEDTIFDPDISTFHFSSLEPVDCQNYEDSCARGFVHRSLELLSFACLYMGI